MNNQYILKRDHLIPLLRKLQRTHTVVAPVRNDYGDTLFTEIDNLDMASIDLENQPQNSLKSFFFPQSEKLCSYIVDNDIERGNLHYSFHPQLPDNRPTVYFGVRSCDMFGVMYSDMIFLNSIERDVYYEQRRHGAVFITFGCNAPFADCFCNATHTGPFLEMGFDLQLTDLENRFFVDTDKARGVTIVEQWPQFFSPATEEDQRAQFQAALEARGLFQRLVHVDLAIQMLADNHEPTAVIEDLSSRCQDCGGCAYVCPTCTCFNIHDRALDAESGERIRSWDACTFAGFTRMAGGHNPVDCTTQSVRKRFFHKLKHDVKRHGRTSCVGCGRCVGMCFGGVDIIKFINGVGAMEENDSEVSHEV